jgi:hypothetical protein
MPSTGKDGGYYSALPMPSTRETTGYYSILPGAGDGGGYYVDNINSCCYFSKGITSASNYDALFLCPQISFLDSFDSCSASGICFPLLG